MQVKLWLLITREILLAIDFQKEIYVMPAIKIAEVSELLSIFIFAFSHLTNNITITTLSLEQIIKLIVLGHSFYIRYLCLNLYYNMEEDPRCFLSLTDKELLDYVQYEKEVPERFLYQSIAWRWNPSYPHVSTHQQAALITQEVRKA